MMTEDDSEMKWRDLALQFDGHRMQAISFLKMILSELPDDQYVSARDFIKAGPRSGEEVLRNRIAALTQPASPALKLPDGWVAVPLKPTPGMMVAGTLVSEFQEDPSGMYRAMVAVAPSFPRTAPIEPICATGGAEWVSIEDEPPRDGSWCIAIEEGDFAGDVVYWGNGEWRSEFGRDDYTHWMYHPAAPGV